MSVCILAALSVASVSMSSWAGVISPRDFPETMLMEQMITESG